LTDLLPLFSFLVLYLFYALLAFPLPSNLRIFFCASKGTARIVWYHSSRKSREHGRRY
jgi:hypothetical protein